MNMDDKHEALGLPKGSIRALIALSLIVIFAMMAIYMQGQLVGTPYKYSNGTEVILPVTDAQQNFALQTLTTVSTLVVAIAAFYFGAKSVAAARGAVKTAEIKRITPKSPFELNTDEQQVLYPIIVETEPEDEDVKETVGKEFGELTSTKHHEYKFKPSDKLKDGDSVTLTFQLANHPKTSKELEVKIKKKKSSEAPKLVSITPDKIELDGTNPITIKVVTEPENEKVNVKSEPNSKEKGEITTTNNPNEFQYKPTNKFTEKDKVTLIFSLDKNSSAKKEVTATKKKAP
jgi:hypothetical protein